MAKRNHETPKRDDKAVLIDRDLAEKARYICLRRSGADGKSLSMAEYLSPMVREQIEADHETELEKHNQEQRRAKKKQP